MLLKDRIIFFCFKLIPMLYWISSLIRADSYYLPYLVIAILSFVSLYINTREQIKPEVLSEQKRLLFATAGGFSLLTAEANYAMLFQGFSGGICNRVYQVGMIVCFVLGSYFSAWNLLACLAVKFEKFSWKRCLYHLPPIVVFGMSFITIAAVDLFFLFTCKYPGNLTTDSLVQISQILSGTYSNHHPFYHTMIIKICLVIGLNIFHDINAAVATYHVFQILFIAGCFSAVTVTLYEMRMKMCTVTVVFLWYLCMPFHIMYSFTMWKDVIFGGFTVVFVVFSYRKLKKIGKNQFLNLIILGISGMGLCLCRSNGLFAFIIIFLCFCLFFRKKEKKLCMLFAGIILTSLFMKHVALEELGISQPDVVEALSIPLQQIARVIVEHDDLSRTQKDLLHQVIDMENVSDIYVPYISDPVKELVREKGNQQAISSQKLEYFKLYIELGIRHPLSYIKAWIDQTRGFWNAGYDYWRWSDGIGENVFGIERTVYCTRINKYLNGYLQIFSENNLLQLFLCIGFYTWMNLILCFMNVIRKDKIGFFISVPILAIIFSLLISSPVYAEFRYAYALFCCLPFLTVAAFYGSD